MSFKLLLGFENRHPPFTETSSHLCLICIKIWKETIVAICVLLFFFVGSFLKMKWERWVVKTLQWQEYEIFGHVIEIIILPSQFCGLFLCCNEVLKRGVAEALRWHEYDKTHWRKGMNMIMQFWPELAPPKQCPSAKTPPSRSTLRVISFLEFNNQIRSVIISYWNVQVHLKYSFV